MKTTSVRAEKDLQIIQRVRDYIQDNNIPVRTLASYMGLTYDQLYQKIFNRQSLDILTYMQLCRLFDVDADEFISDIIKG